LVRLVLLGGPGQLDLDVHRPAIAAAFAERVDQPAQAVERLMHREQTVGPRATPASGVDAQRRTEERRRLRRQRPQPGPVDADQAVMADLLAGQQCPYDVDAFSQAGVAAGLVRPAIAGDVLVRRLARTEGDPQPARRQLEQRGDGLGHDRRVVALAGSVHHSEREPGCVHGRPQPRPGETGLALALAPR
jgi:hypothetical protein